MPRCPTCQVELAPKTSVCPHDGTPLAPSLEGEVLGERYRVVRELGEGGMGRVYLAEHVILGKQVAVKVLRDEYSRLPDLVKRFQLEAVAASQVVDQEGMTTLRLTLDNVSARKEAEARLLQSERELHGMRLLDKERQLNGVIDSAMDAIVAVDQAFRVVLFNPAAAKMFGVPAGEAIGGRIDRFLPRRFRGAHAGAMQAFGLDVTGARRMGEGREIFGLRADGEEFPIEAKISHTEIGGKTMYTAILRDLTQRNSMEAALNLSRQKLHELVAHQQQELERMRTRIAGEIHDELGTLLVGIKGNVSRAIADFERSGAMPVERLQEACRLIDSAAGEVRRLIVDLHPSVLDVLGIWEALDWLAEETEQRTGLRCRIAMAPAATEVELDLERSTALFRIVQEALTNVARHANASEVDIRIGMEDRVIGMELDDNGRGIDVKHHAGSSSWGLAGMAERARNVGGEVKIANLSPGTRISLRLPLEKTGA